MIGDACDCLIPAHPPKEAIQRRRQDASQRFRGDYVHTIRGEEKPKKQSKKGKRASRHEPKAGYRPKRKGTK